jgi:hypothetical protein
MTETINREHPEYAARKSMWQQYRDLYAGGDQLRQHASEYLVRRHKEPNEIYLERLSRVFYENYVGSIIDWYGATLMHREPSVLLDGTDAAAKSFYSVLSENCDLKGTSLTEFFRERFREMMVCGSSIVVVDFPRANAPARTRADEDASGQSRAYLVDYGADELINWNYGDGGTLEWAVIRTSCLRQSNVTDTKWETETRWIYYNRETFRIFRKCGEKDPIEVIDEGRHGLAALHRVPVFELKAANGLWLMNKAALLQVEHFNKSNALSWALTMGLFATPVVYSDKQWQQVVGESYYIQLGKDDRFGWTEPEGKVYQLAADHLSQLKDEIYRVCYLLIQAGSGSASHANQSGLSKKMDYTTTEEVLRCCGAMVRDSMKQILRAIAAARQDEVTIGIAGMDEFDIDEFAIDLDEAKKLLDLGIESPTLRKEVYKKLAFKYLSDARQEVKNRVAEEIEADTKRVAN